MALLAPISTSTLGVEVRQALVGRVIVNGRRVGAGECDRGEQLLHTQRARLPSSWVDQQPARTDLACEHLIDDQRRQRAHERHQWPEQ